jgi:hypothetical protein
MTRWSHIDLEMTEALAELVALADTDYPLIPIPLSTHRVRIHRNHITPVHPPVDRQSTDLSTVRSDLDGGGGRGEGTREQ